MAFRETSAFWAFNLGSRRAAVWVAATVLCAVTAVSGQMLGRKRQAHDLARVLHLSQKFYVAQRSGDLPDDNRVAWRRDSFLDDGADRGVDLAGGYFDAGDHVKFGFPMAFSISILAWSMVQYESAYKTTGEWEHGLENLRWGTDYFLKAHAQENELFAQCGDGQQDHSFWGRPEDFPFNPRPTLKLDIDHPGSDLAGETAAALAASSMVFRESDPEYASSLLQNAEAIYRFADSFRGKYTDSLPEIGGFYTSSGFEDELVWAATWLYKATGNESYLEDAENKYIEFGLQDTYSALGWNQKSAGAQLLLYEATEDPKYAQKVTSLCNWYLNGASRTPGGMLYLSDWGSARTAGYAALVMLLADDLGLGGGQYAALAAQQVNYILGDNPLEMSYIIGYSASYPLRPHHRSSSCPTREECGGCECGREAHDSPEPNPQILEGALVGGPDENDFWEDDRNDYVKNEVATDYNAGIQAAIAGLIARDTSISMSFG